MYYFNCTITGRSLSFSNKCCTFHNVNYRILPKLLSVFHTFKINDKINFIPVSIHLIKLLQIYVQSRDKMVGNIKYRFVSIFYSSFFFLVSVRLNRHTLKIFIFHKKLKITEMAVLFYFCLAVLFNKQYSRCIGFMPWEKYGYYIHFLWKRRMFHVIMTYASTAVS